MCGMHDHASNVQAVRTVAAMKHLQATASLTCQHRAVQQLSLCRCYFRLMAAGTCTFLTMPLRVRPFASVLRPARTS